MLLSSEALSGLEKADSQDTGRSFLLVPAGAFDEQPDGVKERLPMPTGCATS